MDVTGGELLAGVLAGLAGTGAAYAARWLLGRMINRRPTRKGGNRG